MRIATFNIERQMLVRIAPHQREYLQRFAR